MHLQAREVQSKDRSLVSRAILQPAAIHRYDYEEKDRYWRCCFLVEKPLLRILSLILSYIHQCEKTEKNASR